MDERDVSTRGEVSEPILDDHRAICHPTPNLDARTGKPLTLYYGLCRLFHFGSDSWSAVEPIPWI